MKSNAQPAVAPYAESVVSQQRVEDTPANREWIKSPAVKFYLGDATIE
jgi:hypothetical protein